jgi:RNA polymerase sigma-70 factor (ECF subfamily)
VHEGPLVQAFKGSASADVCATLNAVDDLEARLQALIDNARASWPEIRLDAGDFVGWLAARATPSAAAWLAGVHAPDLLLTWACVRGDVAALALFDRKYMGIVRELLQRLIPSSALADDVVQGLTQQLLTGTHERPATLSQYNGQGRLQGWLRVCAVRQAVRARRKAGVESPNDDEALAAVPARGADPELAYMRELYRKEFREAFAEAVTSLTPRERTLLRYAVVDQLTVDDLGRIFNVHRASAARWLASARETLTDRTREALSRRLGVRVHEQQSILRMIQSQLDLSIHTFLQASGDDAG